MAGESVSESDPEAQYQDQPFRFIDLPDELQLNVVERHFEGSWLSLEETLGGSFTCKTFSSLRLERVNKNIRAMCIKTRNKRVKRTVLVEASIPIGLLAQELASQPKFLWLRNHINTINFDGLPTFPFPTEWPLLMKAVPNLGHLSYWFVGPRSTADSALNVIMTSVSNNADALASMIQEGFFDNTVPSLMSFPEIRSFFDRPDPDESGRLRVSLFAIVEVETPEGRPLFTLTNREVVTVNGTEFHSRDVILTSGERVKWKKGATEILITSANGESRVFTETTELQAQLQADIAESMLQVFNFGPIDDFMNMLVIAGAEDDEEEEEGGEEDSAGVEEDLEENVEEGI